MSNYWTANVYFKARNGTYKRVPQIPNRDLFNDKYTGKTTGGFVVYYVSPGKGKTTAFKPVCIQQMVRRVRLTQSSTGVPYARWRRHQPCQQEQENTELLPLLQLGQLWRRQRRSLCRCQARHRRLPEEPMSGWHSLQHLVPDVGRRECIGRHHTNICAVAGMASTLTRPTISRTSHTPLKDPLASQELESLGSAHLPTRSLFHKSCLR